MTCEDYGTCDDCGREDAPVLIYTTFPALEDAKRAGRALIEARLAACVNILPGMVSLFSWQGVLEEASEVVMIIKTRRALADKVMETAKGLHPYELPAMLVLPTAGGSEAYRDWILSETSQSAGE